MKLTSAAMSLLGTSETKKDAAFLDDFKVACRNNIKMLFIMTPSSKVYRKQMRNFSHLLNNSTVINLGDWGNSGLRMVGQSEIESTSLVKSVGENTHVADDDIQLEHKELVLRAMVKIYRNV